MSRHCPDSDHRITIIFTLVYYNIKLLPSGQHALALKSTNSTTCIQPVTSRGTIQKQWREYMKYRIKCRGGGHDSTCIIWNTDFFIRSSVQVKCITTSQSKRPPLNVR